MNNQEPTTEAEEPRDQYRELKLPVKLQDWRAKLSAKAKQEKRYRFYSLYGLISHRETIRAAWKQVCENGGSAGVDGVSIEKIVKQGVEEFLEEIERELKEKTYRAGAVRRVNIPKANGKTRPLGIPNIKDRVVQTAVMLILEPIFEADFLECSNGFRPGRGAHDALKAIRASLEAGLCSVYDADMAGYFDSIPHDKLMACVRMRVVDGSVLRLIKQWLEAPIEEKDESGGRKRRRNDKGTPQGGVISPLLANIYLHWFDKVFHSKKGPAQTAKAVLVRYADDFVIMARHTGEDTVKFIEEHIEGWLGLTINREKTRIVNLREQEATLDFLGYSFRCDRDKYGRKKRYWNMHPSRKSLAREREKLREMIKTQSSYLPIPELIGKLNEHLEGWANYFRLGYSQSAFRQINFFVQNRLKRTLRRKSQRAWKVPKGMSIYSYLKQQGLQTL